MDSIESRETNILENNEKLEAFKKGLKEKMAERLLKTPLYNFSFDAYAVCFTVIVPKTDEFPYAVKLHMNHQESRTGLSIDWTKIESKHSPDVYEVRPAAMLVYTKIYKAGADDNDNDDYTVYLKRYARALHCADYKAPLEFCYEYNSADDPEMYEKLHNLYIAVKDDYRKRCKALCEAYTKECWKLFDVISDY